METTLKIQRITSKGQITLPIAWRRATGAQTITLATKGDCIEIAPARLREDDGEWEVLADFSSLPGGGISAKKLLKALRV